MNNIIQNILVFSALIIAIAFIVKTYIWSPSSKKKTKACGGDNGCGCH